MRRLLNSYAAILDTCLTVPVPPAAVGLTPAIGGGRRPIYGVTPADVIAVVSENHVDPGAVVGLLFPGPAPFDIPESVDQS